MYISRSRGYNGTYCLNARRENKECSRKPRAVRIKVILEEIYKALGELKFDEKDYSRNLKDLKGHVDVKLDKLIIEKRSLLGAKRRKQTKINEHVLEQQMRARDPVGKDLLAREIFLNWEIDQ